MATVVLAGTLDTKGREYAYVRDRLRQNGVDVLLVDVGILGEPLVTPDIAREAVADAAGVNIADLVRVGDRGRAIEAMSEGLRAIVRQLYEAGMLDAILGLGGSGGSSLIAAAMRELPIGAPKLLVSTVASGDTRPYVDTSDLMMIPSVVDISGINRISERILTNAAAAAAVMAKASATFQPATTARPMVGATMFGVTTPCVTAARERLEELGYEVLVFHATGAGGRSMERLIRDGFITAALDITTTELADELVGGVLSAGPDRLEAAAEMGIPQVVSLGALDMVNFGPIDSVPAQFAGRNFYRHNPNVTLMRTTAEECAALGSIVARKLNAARGPVILFIPLRGVSAIAREGEVFHDAAADAALIAALREQLDPRIEVREVDTDINDPALARAMADALHETYIAWAGARERSEA